MLSFLRATAEIELFGAFPERCLNRWAEKDLSFRKLKRKTELSFCCTVFASELRQLIREAERAQCEISVLRYAGLPTALKRLWNRPVLLIAVLTALTLSFALQNYVWFVRVEGNERVSAERIYRALEEEGVSFGVWGPALDSEMLKNRMLNRIPELRWLAVNREGGLVTVLCAEREPEQPETETEGITNLVADRPAVIREMRVVNGFAEKAVGDTVEAGDILVSGLMEWTTHIQATHAAGEVYGQTLHGFDLICPDHCGRKHYTGRSEICRTLIFQRKRRKISGNSGIFGTSCDRMIEIDQLKLPGGFCLPVYLETETLLEYSLEPEIIPVESGKEQMALEALRQTEAELKAGMVESGQTRLSHGDGCYLCRAAMNCLELISRTVPAELYREEYENGQTDQRGTN